MNPQNISHYQIQSKLGAGGMGEVYLAVDTRLGRQVAIKLLPAQSTASVSRVRRFEQEARAASALNHPNIITIFEIGHADAGHFIVMEYVQGRTIHKLIPLHVPLESFLSLGLQMARAIGVAHAAGITHRDLKPDNIMVRDDGYVKVLDFGLARLTTPASIHSEADTLVQTNPGVLVGTVQYMSPEQARSETVGPASDIFSLGVIFYEMLTAKHPFSAPTLLATLNAITSQSPIPPSRLNPELPAPLEQLVLRMLEKDAQLRPTASDIEAAVQMLERHQDGVKVTSDFSASLLRQPSGLPARMTVGRESERAQLRESFQSVAAGKGMLLCVTGEPGIGKTTLVEDFLGELSAQSQPFLIARGRCSERLAGAEAYLPWFEAMDNLLRRSEHQSLTRTGQPGEDTVVQLMRQLAPTWYVQVSTMASEDTSAERLSGERAVSQERMKREMGALLQELSERQPLVLFFDDLHWADASTIDMLGYIASKFDALRVLIVTTYRPSDLLLAKHPFLQLRPDLQARGVCREIAIEFLSQADIASYLSLEFPEHRFPAELPALIHAKTEGNPLFMADLVRYLRDRGVIAQESAGQWRLAESLPEIEQELPESVRGMIERKIAQLSDDDRRLLVAASVQGYEFDSTVVAKALNLDPADVEERLEVLERVHALVRLISEKEFPGHVLTVGYRFVHVLYQNALYGSLRPTRRAQLSAAIADAMLGFYGKQSRTVASKLAFLFEAARDWTRAADYYLIAAREAADVFAPREAETLTRRGLKMLVPLPESPERSRQELKLQIVLGQALMTTRGYAMPEVEQAFVRTRELCLQLDERTLLFRAQFNLSIVYVVRADYAQAVSHAEASLRLAENLQHPAFLVMGHWALGLSRIYSGHFVEAHQHFEQTIAIHNAGKFDPLVTLYGGVLSRAHLSTMCRYLGWPDQAQRWLQEARVRAAELQHPIGFCQMYSLVADLGVFQCDVGLVEESAREIMRYATEHGLPYYAAIGRMMTGWAQTWQDLDAGIATLRQGLAEYLATGTKHQRSRFLVLLAESQHRAGKRSGSLATLAEAEAIIVRSNEHYYESELYRLKGRVLLDNGDVTAAEQSFQHSLAVARAQQAKAQELRAALHLAQLWRQQGNVTEARTLLGEIYDWFTEGFATPDLQEAKALLNELS